MGSDSHLRVSTARRRRSADQESQVANLLTDHHQVAHISLGENAMLSRRLLSSPSFPWQFTLEWTKSHQLLQRRTFQTTDQPTELSE